MLLLIDNYDSFTYNLVQALAPRVGRLEVVRNDARTVGEIEAMGPSAIVLSPGPCTPAEAGICVELVRALGPRVPILGVCLGHQAIGVAYGGVVTRAPEVVHGKSSLVFHRRQGLLAGLPLPFPAGRYHSLVVERKTLPPELVVEADTAGGVVMAMRHAVHPVWGVQFHPESILTPDGPRVLENFLALAGAA
ncbi:MAG TPA: aminodeoxychorismate/anthranilate synthase component II [Thermoanaerobaculaceae bacterium]|nr:aminodeoxychorismate/anthranilate synthase component II [Thermoanaerobaculaceae bacterium]HRS16136.1 aminodeoxychorismate/anthranilate synthase component II [Thermoanaerobaculaceae bacterium]